MNFFWLVWAIGLEADKLIAFLGEVPQTSGVRGFQIQNNVYKLLWLYQCSTGPDSNEDEAYWLKRTALASSSEILGEVFRSQRNLKTCIDLMMEQKRPYYFTQHGIRRSDEWHLLRTLANLIAIPVQYRGHPTGNFDVLYRTLGGDEVDWDFASEYPCDCD